MGSVRDLFEYVVEAGDYLEKRWLWVIGILLFGLAYGIYLIVTG